MGGNALKKYGISTSRKETDEFIRIGKVITNQMKKDLNAETVIVKSFHTKDSHGDADVLFKRTAETKDIDMAEYVKVFNPQAIYNNSGVVSFDYDDFQVDIISINEDDWDVAQTYFSYDPLGNIMGKVFHKFGLSYGWNGLTYKFRSFSGSLSKSINVSKDARRIFEFAGYDYDRYLEGFETVEDIFKYLISNKFFDPIMFEFENLKHIDRKRNLRRKSYHTFIEYLKENKIPKVYEFNPSKDAYLPMIDEFFPEVNILEQIKTFTDQNVLNKLISEKFNGNHIMEMFPELKGKELGYAISKYKEMFGTVDEYNEVILEYSFEEICADFKWYYNNVLKSND